MHKAASCFADVQHRHLFLHRTTLLAAFDHGAADAFVDVAMIQVHFSVSFGSCRLNARPFDGAVKKFSMR